MWYILHKSFNCTDVPLCVFLLVAIHVERKKVMALTNVESTASVMISIQPSKVAWNTEMAFFQSAWKTGMACFQSVWKTEMAFFQSAGNTEMAFLQSSILPQCTH